MGKHRKEHIEGKRRSPLCAPSEKRHGAKAQSTSFHVCRYGIVHFRVFGQRISFRHRLWRARRPRFGSRRTGIHPCHKRHRACGLFIGESNGSRKASKHSCRRAGNRFRLAPCRNPANPKRQRLAVAGMLVVLDFGYVGKRHLLFRCANPLCQQPPFPSGGHLVCRRIARSVPASFLGAKQRYRSRDYRSFDHRTWLRSCSAPQRAARSPPSEAHFPKKTSEPPTNAMPSRKQSCCSPAYP